MSVDVNNPKPILRMDDEEAVLTVPTGPFTHTILRDSRLGPERTDIRGLTIYPFTDEEIDEYYRALKSWKWVGRWLFKVALLADRPLIPGGLLGRLRRRYRVALHEPSDQTTMISGVMVEDGAVMHLERLRLQVSDLKGSA